MLPLAQETISLFAGYENDHSGNPFVTPIAGNGTCFSRCQAGIARLLDDLMNDISFGAANLGRFFVALSK